MCASAHSARQFCDMLNSEGGDPRAGNTANRRPKISSMPAAHGVDLPGQKFASVACSLPTGTAEPMVRSYNTLGASSRNW